MGHILIKCADFMEIRKQYHAVQDLKEFFQEVNPILVHILENDRVRCAFHIIATHDILIFRLQDLLP